MSAQPRTQEVDGEPVLGPTPPDGLYRYQPMPPAYRDADGYLVEDSMGRSDRHMCETSLWYHALTVRLPAATVCSNLFLHYRQGDRGATLVPDLFVALGVPPIEDRDNYKLWQDPVPDLAMEMLADSTTANDECSKRDTYKRLGVREYWLFDPAGHELSTALEGYRLGAKRYQPIKADAAGRLRSEVLGLALHVRDGELRFRDPATGEDLRTYSEATRERAAERIERTPRSGNWRRPGASWRACGRTLTTHGGSSPAERLRRRHSAARVHSLCYSHRWMARDLRVREEAEALWWM